MRALLERAGVRFKKLPQGRAFARWRSNIEHKKFLLGRLDFIRRRLIHRRLSGPFNRWAGRCRLKRVETRVETACLQRLKPINYTIN